MLLLGSLIASVVSWFIPRKRFVMLLWLPSTLFWLAILLYSVFVARLEASKWADAQIANLLLTSVRVFSAVMVVINLIRIPRKQGLNLRFGAIAAGVSLSILALEFAADIANNRIIYEFAASDARGQSIRDFTLEYQYRSRRLFRLAPRDEFEVGVAKSDANGRVRVPIYGPEVAFTASSPQAVASEIISIHSDGNAGASWNAVTSRGTHELGSAIDVGPGNRPAPIQIQFQTSTNYQDLLLYNVNDPRVVVDLAKMGRLNRLLYIEYADLVLARYHTIPDPEDARNYVTTTLLFPLRNFDEISQAELGELGYPPAERRRSTLSAEELSFIREKAASLRKSLGAEH